jgi:DNA-binding PadR family transcriptional regulator
LLRLEQYDWISSSWGVSENNRKAKFYSLTKAGRKQLAREEDNWEQMARVINRVLKATS